MRRTEQVQGLRLMKFEEVYGRTHRGGLSQAEAAEVLGVSERTFRRWRDRYEAEGADGLYDRRLGRVSARRAPVDEVARVLELFDTRYWDLTAKHFHEKLVADHGFKRSYNWLRLSLQAHGRRRAAPMRGAHRRKRPRRALPGMMLHQDGSSHEWVPGRWWDLIVTMDDATSDIYSAFFVAEEGTMSSFQGVSEAIRAKGLFCSLYADRARPLLEHARGPAARWTRTPRPRSAAAPGAARHRVDPGPTRPRQGGARSACSAPCRSACPRNSGSPASPTWPGPTASSRRSSCHNTTPASRPRPRTRAPPFVPFTGALNDILCIHEERTVSNDNTVRYKAPGTSDPRRPPPPPLRQGQGPRPRIPRRHNGRLPWTAMSGAIPRRWPTYRQPNPRGRVTRFDATDRRPCGQVDSRSAPDHFPTGPATATEAVNSYGT